MNSIVLKLVKPDFLGECRKNRVNTDPDHRTKVKLSKQQADLRIIICWNQSSPKSQYPIPILHIEAHQESRNRISDVLSGTGDCLWQHR